MKMWRTIVKSFFTWLTAIGRNLWEDYLHEKLIEDIKEIAKDAIEKAECFTNSDTYIQKRDAVVLFIFGKIELPWFLRPFKKAIKAILAKKIDKVIDDLLEKAKGQVG